MVGNAYNSIGLSAKTPLDPEDVDDDGGLSANMPLDPGLTTALG